jgi:hypothetical protein
MQTLGKSIIKAVAGVILYRYLTSSVGDATGRNTVVGRWNAKSFLDHLNHLEKMVRSGSESEGAENIQSSFFFLPCFFFFCLPLELHQVLIDLIASLV